MIRKSYILIFCLVIIPSTVLWSGGASEEDAEEVFDEFDWRNYEGRELNVLFRHGEHTDQLYEYLIPQFEDETGVTVNVTWMGRDGWAERLYALMMDETPDFDVIMVHDTDTVFLAAGGYLEALDEYLNDPIRTPGEADFAMLPESVVDGFRLDGNLYNMPTFGSPYLQYYRRDIYNQLGLTAAETWDEYLENSRAVVAAYEAGAIDVPYGHVLQGRDGQHLWEEFLARAWPRGGGLVDVDSREVIIRNEANQEALAQMIQEIEEGLVPPEWSQTAFADVADQITAGVAAATVVSSGAGTWIVEGMDDPDKIGSATIPGIRQSDGSIRRMSPMAATGLVINAAAPNKGPAWHLIAYWLSRPELLRDQATIGIPPIPAIYEREPGEPELRFAADAIGEQFNSASPYPPVVGTVQSLRVLATQLSEVLAGRKSIDAAFADAESEAQRLLEW